MNLKEIKQRFEAKYPKGWRVKGNRKWSSFMKDTDCDGDITSNYYYTNFSKKSGKFIFDYDYRYDGEYTLISVEEFFSLWNNTNQEIIYEIY